MTTLRPLNDRQPTAFKRIFGTWHRNRRLKMGLTQVQLAVELDMSSVAISHIERGVNLPKDMRFHMELLDELEKRMKEGY